MIFFIIKLSLNYTFFWEREREKKNKIKFLIIKLYIFSLVYHQFQTLYSRNKMIVLLL